MKYLNIHTRIPCGEAYETQKKASSNVAIIMNITNLLY